MMIKINKKWLISLSFIICHISLSTAQTTEVRGTVVNSSTGEAFAGARITQSGTRNVAMTEEDGAFTLKVSDQNGVLRVEAPGFDVQLVPLRGRADVTVRLLPTGTAEPAYNENSLAARTSEKSTRMQPAVTSIDENMGMRLSGSLRTVAHSGLDAGGAAIYQRGLHSINMATQPLFVVDGIIWQSQDGIASLHEGYFSNPLALLAPDDIESIEVLKDGTAIWGAKAAGGVVLIKTKRSHNMATEITVNLSAGIKQQGKSIPMLGASDYRILASDILGDLTEDELLELNPQRNFRFLDDNQNTSFYLSSHNNTDWTDQISRTATTQNYGVAVRGGDDVALYAFSLGYARNDGNIDNTNFDRLNVRFNSDIDLTKKLKTRADIAFTQVTRNIFDDGIFGAASPRFMAYTKSPLYNAHQFDASGKLFSRLSDVDELGVGNPLAITENVDGKTKNYRFIASLAPTYNFSERFSISGLAGFSWDKIKESSFTPDFGLAEVQLYNAQGDWYGEGDNSVASLMTRHSMLTLDLHADWTALSTQCSTLNLKGGFRYLNDTFQSDYGQGYNTGSDNLRSLSVTNASLRTTDGANEDWRTLTWYAAADYNLLNRYFLSATAVLESNSRFGKHADGGISLAGIKWGLFPSVTAAWVVTNEKFMQPLSAINYLKLHVGYDLAGNDDLPIAATRTYFQTISYVGLAKGLVLANIGSDKLKWEQTGTLSAGFDMNLLNNRLSLAFNYFHSSTSDLLVRKQLRQEYGLQDYWTNDGRMTNTGFETSLQGRIVDSKDWKLNASLTVGHYKNKIEELTDGDFTTDVLGATMLTGKGNPLGVFYGYKTLGVFATQQEADAANLAIVDKTGHQQKFRAGDMHYADLKGDGIINDDDRTIIGDPNPDIYGNFSLSLTWKRFTLDALFTYSLGNDAFNAMRAQLESGSTLANQTEAMRRRWTADGQATDVPRTAYGDPMGNARFSDRWIEDASYLKLRQLSVSYQLPIKPKAIQGMSVWAAVSNVFTVTKYLGCDPEFSYGSSTLYQGIDAGLLPPSRAYNIGVKLNL